MDSYIKSKAAVTPQEDGKYYCIQSLQGDCKHTAPFNALQNLKTHYVRAHKVARAELYSLKGKRVPESVRKAQMAGNSAAFEVKRKRTNGRLESVSVTSLLATKNAFILMGMVNKPTSHYVERPNIFGKFKRSFSSYFHPDKNGNKVTFEIGIYS